MRTLRDDAKLPDDQVEMIASIIFRSQCANFVMDTGFDPSKSALRADIRSIFVEAKTDIIRTFLGVLALQTLIVLSVIFGFVSILTP